MVKYERPHKSEKQFDDILGAINNCEIHLFCGPGDTHFGVCTHGGSQWAHRYKLAVKGLDKPRYQLLPAYDPNDRPVSPKLSVPPSYQYDRTMQVMVVPVTPNKIVVRGDDCSTTTLAKINKMMPTYKTNVRQVNHEVIMTLYRGEVINFTATPRKDNYKQRVPFFNEPAICIVSYSIAMQPGSIDGLRKSLDTCRFKSQHPDSDLPAYWNIDSHKNKPVPTSKHETEAQPV